MMRPLIACIAAACSLLTLPLSAQQSTQASPADSADRLTPLRQQAEQGDLHAAQQLYMRYAVAGMTEEARNWSARYNELLTAQAEAGNTKAMLQLASRYLTGEDYTPVSIEKAVTWFTRASEAGEPTAAYVLGEIFAKQGNTVISDRSYERAYKLYTERVEADAQDAVSLYWLGYMEQNGIGVERNTSSALAKLEKSAALGSSWAATQLFKTYINGIDTDKDEAKAFTYARRLADENEDGMMSYVIASALIFGRGVEQDPALGEQYLDKAVRANIPDAVYMKASRLEADGRFSEALPLLRQAASMRQREAVVRMGILLLKGAEGVEQDTAKGLSMLELASDRLDSPQAAWELAKYYQSEGEGDIADSWYVIASKRGIAEAMARRGLLHLLPNPNVSWSPTEAYRWWRIGKEAGDPTCTLYINLFLYVFTPLLLLLVFGVPAWLGHRARKQNPLQEGS